jgi:hypothetical protein
MLVQDRHIRVINAGTGDSSASSLSTPRRHGRRLGQVMDAALEVDLRRGLEGLCPLQHLSAGWGVDVVDVILDRPWP